jgi:NAD(P)-dependent dehydrogenase (short-subunit alcohol dehydrogenase family)
VSPAAHFYGRIINLSSMGGEFTFPLAGAYHATKYAVESINEAMRFELRPFGIAVITIQPAPVLTPLAAHAVDTLVSDPDGPYRESIAALHRIANSTLGYITPKRVANAILHAAHSRAPRTRYKIGAMAHMMPFTRHLLSDRLWDSLLALLYR